MEPNNRKELEKDIRKLEAEIGVPEKFSYDVFNRGDDWSFVITLHSFLEAALTQLIIKTLKMKELEEIISRLDMIDKVAYTKSLSILSKGTRRYLRKLSEIRNFYVHNIKSISINLRQYLKSSDSNQLKGFIKAIRFGIRQDIKLKEKGEWINRDAICERFPRFAIFISGHTVISEITAQIGLEIHRKKIEEYKIKIAESFFPPPPKKKAE